MDVKERRNREQVKTEKIMTQKHRKKVIERHTKYIKKDKGSQNALKYIHLTVTLFIHYI